jgi:flagellar basal-body rod protein FlgG
MSDFLLAYSAVEAKMKVIDVVANNLANSQTSGFKKDFSHVFATEEGFEVGTAVDLTPGDMLATENSLDIAISGAGFFAIQTPAGVRYTRAGNFAVDQDGDLATKDGMKVLSDSDSPINVGQGLASFTDSGAVVVNGAEAGRVKIVTFEDSLALEKEGSSRFKWNGDPAAIEEVADARIKVGHLEQSNVSPVDEMVHLMSAYREFEAVQRTLKTLMTDMNSKLIQELGRLS